MKSIYTILLSSLLFISVFQIGNSFNRYISTHKNRILKNNKDNNNNINNERIGIIIVDHGSKKSEANNMLIELVNKYKKYSNINIVEAAHMELAEPSIYTAFKKCVEQGANYIICHPFFLSKGKHVQEDIPLLMKEASSMNNNINYKITDPLGVQDKILELIDIAINKSTDSI